MQLSDCGAFSQVWVMNWVAQLPVAAVAVVLLGSFSSSSQCSLGTGILAMLASEKKRLLSSCHSSCCSNSWLPTNLIIEVSLGKMSTRLVRRLIYLFSLSIWLVL